MTRKKKLKKPSELLNLYSRELDLGIGEKLSPISFELNLSYRSPRVAHISGYVIFRKGWTLEFDEIIAQERIEIKKMKYRYHVMDKSKKVIFRYENVPHFPKIKTHPHHKHAKNKVVESKAPGLLEVIEEIETLIVMES